MASSSSAAAAAVAAAAAAAAAAEEAVRTDIAARLNTHPDFSRDVKRRPVGGGKQAAYIPGDRVLAIANESFGFDRWSCEIKKLEVDYAVQVRGGSGRGC